MKISFTISNTDAYWRDEILDRLGLENDARLNASMDMTATHANGCPLDFKRLAQTNDRNLHHDIGGIARHLDRGKGKLTGCFLPRLALKTNDERKILCPGK